MSQREVWLLALLPAALVVILSFALPGPKKKVADMEARLVRLTSQEADAHKQLHDQADALKKGRNEMQVLEAQQADLLAQIAALEEPATVQRRVALDMAGVLDELARRLSQHGAQVLAMEAQNQRAPSTSASGVKAKQNQSNRDPDALRPEWVVSLVATWPVLRKALADAEAFPQGLALSAMNMEPAPSSVTLRRWELVVTVSEQSP
ncbi:MAG: hypothetical protein AAGB26_13390 [Planctomycetota bacterium]